MGVTDNAILFCVLNSPEKMLIREADKYSLFSLWKRGDVVMSSYL